MQTIQLSKYHKERATLTEFAGYELPAWYTGILEECWAVRRSAGLFDVSHMGRAIIEGKDAEAFLNYLTTNDVRSLNVGGGQYSLICSENGGIVDDITVMRIAPSSFLMVFNASNRNKDLEWISRMSAGFDTKLTDVSEDVAMFALQGPLSVKTLQRITDIEPDTLPRFGLSSGRLAGLEGDLSRTGYTGEDGFEIFLWNCNRENPEKALSIWDAIIKAGEAFGVRQCGLGARDVLRLEAGLCLYGNDIDESTTPLEAGLNFTVKFGKGIFVGREALLERKARGIDRTRVGLKMDGRAIPRPGDHIVYEDRQVGIVTSGSFSPTLTKGIGMAYVNHGLEEGCRINVKSRGRNLEAEIATFPLFDKRLYGRSRL